MLAWGLWMLSFAYRLSMLSLSIDTLWDLFVEDYLVTTTFIACGISFFVDVFVL